MTAALPIVLVLVVVLVLDSSRRRGVVLLAAASVSFAGAPPEEQPSRTKPILIAKGQDWLVHGITYPLHDDQARFRTRPWGGCAVLYTRPSTGEMKAIVSTGTVEVPTERISYFQTRLVGLACDAERLYAVVWFSGRVWDHPPHPAQELKGGAYSLHVFWLADGTSLSETWLLREAKSPVSRPSAVAPGLPEVAPQETLEKGPLKLIETGVSCYGIAFEFEGKKLTAQRAADDAAAHGVEGVGKEIAYTGIARNGKLGACVEAREMKPMAIFLDDRRKWEPSVLGQQVTVKGVLRVRMIGSDDGTTQALRQPVFYMTEYTLKVEGTPAPKQ